MEMTDRELICVSWYEHSCEWITKYCDEHHVRSALVPRDVLEKYLAPKGGA